MRIELGIGQSVHVTHRPSMHATANPHPERHGMAALSTVRSGTNQFGDLIGANIIPAAAVDDTQTNVW